MILNRSRSRNSTANGYARPAGQGDAPVHPLGERRRGWAGRSGRRAGRRAGAGPGRTWRSVTSLWQTTTRGRPASSKRVARTCDHRADAPPAARPAWAYSIVNSVAARRPAGPARRPPRPRRRRRPARPSRRTRPPARRPPRTRPGSSTRPPVGQTARLPPGPVDGQHPAALVERPRSGPTGRRSSPGRIARCWPARATARRSCSWSTTCRPRMRSASACPSLSCRGTVSITHSDPRACPSGVTSGMPA